MTIAEFVRPFQLSEEVTDANVCREDGTYIYVPLVKDFQIPAQIGSIVVVSAKLDVMGPKAVLIINEPDENTTVSEEVIDAVADKILAENGDAMEVLA